ncbi:MAG: hypothetical protein ACREHC_02390 [Candidatus Levyibacteriota bacterium]
MPLILFDYLIFPTVQEGKLLPIYIPRISIYLSIKHNITSTDIKCILDSGSDFNLFPADIAEALGIKITKGKMREHIGIGNHTIIAYEHEVKLFVKDYNFKTTVHFSYDHKIPLLGRHSFFRFFKRVTFNEKALQVELEY